MKRTIRGIAAGFAAASLGAAALAQPAGGGAAISAPLPGGGVQHLASGLDCPASLGGLTYQSSDRIAADRTDIACEYGDVARAQALSYLVFAAPTGRETEHVVYGFAQNMMENDTALELNMTTSRECQRGLAGAMTQLGQSSDGADGPACVVLTKDKFATLVTVWERDSYFVMARVSGLDTRITNAVTAAYAMSYQTGGQSASSSASQPAAAPPASERKGVGKAEVDTFCAQSTTTTRAGMQFNGKLASPDVMRMAAGRYNYPDNGALLYFPDKSYLIRLPETRDGIYGTDGDDMMMSGGMLAGCSTEQLSEVIERNGLVFENFELVRPLD